MIKRAYNSFEGSYGSEGGTALKDNPRESSSGLESNFLEDINRVVTRDRTLARDYTQDSGE